MIRSAELMKAKEKVAVELRMSDGSDVVGFMFATTSERVLDVMNGPMPYIPFECENGELMIVSKATIVRVRPKDNEHMRGSKPGSESSFWDREGLK